MINLPTERIIPVASNETFGAYLSQIPKNDHKGGPGIAVRLGDQLHHAHQERQSSVDAHLLARPRISRKNLGFAISDFLALALRLCIHRKERCDDVI